MPPAPLLRKVIVFLLVGSITTLHYTTAPDAVPYHVLYRELYFLPILLAAFWFGLAGGLTTSLAITVLYSPQALFDQAFAIHNFSNFLEITLFIGAGVLLGSLHDREKAKERKLREAESLAAMGRSVSAVAHEMKAPLAAIGGFARQVRRKLPADSSEEHKLGIITDQTSRLETMIQDMLSFARPLALQALEIDLYSLVEEGMEVAAETAAQQGVILRLQSEEKGLWCQVDKSRFLHVLFNVVINAIEASPAGGRVIVRLFRQNGSAWLEVLDRGAGIPADQRQRIFEPFFTTKKKGTGLGLPIAKKIIEAHNGRLEVADREGGGTVFQIRLPLKGQ